MKTAFLSTLILALSTSAGFAQQPAQCRNFEATIALQMTKEGCLSQIDLCTVGTVMSNEPALSGATWLFTAHGMTETAGLASLPKALQSYAGTVLVTAKGGTFTTTTAGMYDTESQAFSQLEQTRSRDQGALIHDRLADEIKLQLRFELQFSGTESLAG